MESSLGLRAVKLGFRVGIWSTACSIHRARELVFGLVVGGHVCLVSSPCIGCRVARRVMMHPSLPTLTPLTTGWDVTLLQVSG